MRGIVFRIEYNGKRDCKEICVNSIRVHIDTVEELITPFYSCVQVR